jgi:hypothetical protein
MGGGGVWLWSSSSPFCKQWDFLDFLGYFVYFIQHCFISRPSEFTVSEDAEIEPRTVATLVWAVRRSNHSARSHLYAIAHTHLERHLPPFCAPNNIPLPPVEPRHFSILSPLHPPLLIYFYIHFNWQPYLCTSKYRGESLTYTVLRRINLYSVESKLNASMKCKVQLSKSA